MPSAKKKPVAAKKTKPVVPKKNPALPVAKVVAALAAEYADVECALEHESPFQLLIATILSAQCTDERVNIVTKVLFAKYPTAHALARAPLETVEKIVQSTGFFRAKAKNITECAKQLVQKHGGEVPQNMDSLVVLPGVGRKTANVVLGTAYGIPSGVVVDTHVGRITQRLGFTKQTDAVKIERDLMELLPVTEWIMFAHRLIHHGRRVCQSRKPKCENCVLAAWCAKVGV